MNDNHAALEALALDISQLFRGCADQMQAKGGLGKRGEPMTEVYHTFANLPNVETAKVSIFDISGLNVEGGGSAAQQRQQLGYRIAINRLKQFVATQALSVMRMEPWEDKIDFSAIGWEGQKPTEVAEEIGKKIEEFFVQYPNLEAELTGGKGGAAIGGR